MCFGGYIWIGLAAAFLLCFLFGYLWLQSVEKKLTMLERRCRRYLNYKNKFLTAEEPHDGGESII